MSRFASTSHSIVEPSTLSRSIAGVLVASYALAALVPLVWILMTGFKTPPDAIAYPPEVTFSPSLEGYVNLFTSRSRQTPEYMDSLPPPETWYDELVRGRNMVITGPSRFAEPPLTRNIEERFRCCYGDCVP
jgi:multiple sugar transport system permease protein